MNLKFGLGPIMRESISFSGRCLWRSGSQKGGSRNDVRGVLLKYDGDGRIAVIGRNRCGTVDS